MDLRILLVSRRCRGRSIIHLALMTLLGSFISAAQVENVPAGNQVYEFLDRMGVRGIIPLYSNVVIPIARKEVVEYLMNVDQNRSLLNETEIDCLDKFKNEFAHEISPSDWDPFILLGGSQFGQILSDREKYLYCHTDSTLSFFMEFIGSLERRQASGSLFGGANSTLAEFGGRIRGTVKNKLGYYLQATNGTLAGNRNYALSDPRLRGNVKLNDLDSPYFDFTEAYLRADLDWFNLQFGREFTSIGTGYTDRLLLSNNAPAFDFLKLDFRHKSFRFIFLQGSLVDPNSLSNKYLALHRVQFSLFDLLNVGLSEMIIYQRNSVDFAYLNPINFYKSSEHSLRDKDNAFLNFDLEIFPVPGYKLYGTWMIDDIDFKKMGSGWWGNEFGWQGGIAISEIAGLENLDGVVEYVRLEPYVYSNRLEGNSYTNNSIGLGSNIEPNSDKLALQLRYQPNVKLRTWLTLTTLRHGDNEFAELILIKNHGGDIRYGHRPGDPETAIFLDGNRVAANHIQIKAVYEPVTNIFLAGIYEYEQIKNHAAGRTDRSHHCLLKLSLEY